MSRQDPSLRIEDDPVEPDELVDFFARAERSDPLIGTELEKFGVVVADRSGSIERPEPVEFEAHISRVLEALIERHGWGLGATRGTSGQIVELQRDNASITLEPGGQLELSGKPLPNLHETCAEFTQHYSELHEVSVPLGLAWMAVGYHPWATRDEIDWVPKDRYRVMREYLPTRGNRGLDMMVRTCTVQANFDFGSEQDCGERYHLALSLGSLITAIFANSPYAEGEASGLCSLRSAVWFDVDPDRCGIPQFMFDGTAFSYQRYVDWALDVPMFFVVRDGAHHPHNATFREYLRDGFTDPIGRSHRATKRDWELHLSTVFPEIRLKPFIEVRTADSVGSRFVCALPAVWKAILYDDDARAAAAELIGKPSYAEMLELSTEARKTGMRSARVHELCKRLLALARTALDRMDIRDNKDRTEARFLDPLEPLVAKGSCPGDEVLAKLGRSPGTGAEARRTLVREFHFAGALPD